MPESLAGDSVADNKSAADRRPPPKATIIADLNGEDCAILPVPIAGSSAARLWSRRL